MNEWLNKKMIELPKITCIYKIVNKKNGKTYIGQTENVYKRWKEHVNNSNSALRGYTELYLDMNKLGIEMFEFEIIEECKKEELYDLEVKYIKEYNSYTGFENSNGYNLSLGGKGSKGLKKTKESIELTASKLRGRKYVFTEEHKKHISESKKGYKHTEKYKNEMSKRMKLDNHPLARKIKCNGKTYDCAKSCAIELNIKYSSLMSMLQRGSQKSEKYGIYELKYISQV